MIDENDEDELLFFPPLWQQRRYCVTKILRLHRVTQVLDLGTGEGKLLQFLKLEENISQLVGVDINKYSLELAVKNCEHRLGDYVSFSHPLSLQLLEGDITVPDSRFVGIEAATCIEVIEHLQPASLKQFAWSIFACMRPKVVVITTPNADYNIVFENAGQGFRDPDHKFEWSRSEFQQWCSDVSSQYYYDVTFSGVGNPPRDTSHIGYCTQIATFVRKQELFDGVEASSFGTPYTHFAKIYYESKDPLLKKEAMSEICYHYSILSQESSSEYVPTELLYEVRSLQRSYNSEEEMRAFIEASDNFEWSDDGKCVRMIYKEEESDFSDPGEEEGEENALSMIIS